MASKMSMLKEDSIVGYDKRIANYAVSDTVAQLTCDKVNIIYDSEDDEEDDFYDHYEPYEEDFDDGDYQPFDLEQEEKEHQSQISPKLTKPIKPVAWINSPSKSEEKSPNKSPKQVSPTWWDKNETVDQSKRIVNGVLNYAALLPPPTPKKINEKIISNHLKNKLKKNAKNKDNGSKQPDEKKFKNGSKQPNNDKTEIQKPTRFCLSVIKKTKCFHGTRCRFAHDYSDLKECNFGDKCKKIVFVKTNPDGTIELSNKNEVTCNFKHTKESKNSYLKRVPQQHTSPKK
jgi:hypothetical protein